MHDAREPESERLRRARDQIERGKLKQAILTLWDEGEDARVTDDRTRLQAVAELALAIRDGTSGRVQASAGELIEHVERALASVVSAPPAFSSSPQPSGPAWPKFLFAAAGIAGLVGLLIFAGGLLAGGYSCLDSIGPAMLLIVAGGLLGTVGLGGVWIGRRRRKGAPRGLFDYVAVPAVSLITGAAVTVGVVVLMALIMFSDEWPGTRCWFD